MSFADDAAQALEKIRDIDLVIVDSDLPGAGGVELCRRVKEDRLSRHIPVIVLDSQGTGDIVRDAYQAGAGACIPKNQARDKLLEDISQVLMDAALRRDRLVLVVDDSITVRSLVSRSLKEAGFRVMEAENGRAALRLLKESRPDIISERHRHARDERGGILPRGAQRPGLASIPFVVMSSNDQRPIMRRMLRIGADSYIVKPFNIEQLVITVEKLLSDRLLLLQKEKERLETEQKLMLASITSLCAALEARDPYTRGHSEAVCTIAALIAKGMGLSSEEVDLVRLGGRLHDIGKIGVPDSILLKPGRLSSDDSPSSGGTGNGRGDPKARALAGPDPAHSPLPPRTHRRQRIPRGAPGLLHPAVGQDNRGGGHLPRSHQRQALPQGHGNGAGLEIISQAKGTQLCPDCVEAFIAMEPWNSGPAAFAARQGSGAGIIQASTP